MKKRYLIVPAAMALLYACLSDNDLPEGFEKVKVYRISKSFINKLNERAFDRCYSSFNPAMQQSMSREKLTTTLNSVLSSLGAFVRFKGVSVMPKKLLGEDYAVCTVKCIYENGPATFTLSLDKNMQVGGLYIK